ncbi:MAG: sulfatase-like hydrolase/transferase [Myxococcales bacterium]|nr:sulfatase-like hydrolase/transferase [Myxococcales bacterium]
MMLLPWLVGCVHPTDIDPEPSDRALVFTGERPRNVLMISIDTLRRDHVDRYATDGVTRMPFLSSLLQTGVALDDHQQCGDWTFHSMTCTLLGRQTEEIGWVARPTGADPTPLPDQPMLAFRLDQAGYQSLLASTTGWLQDSWNNTRGYQPDLAHGVVQATEVMDVALEGLSAALDTAPTKPWFLHAHLVEPHAAYDPPETYREELHALPPIPWDLDDHVEQYAAADSWPDLTPEMQDLLDRHLQARYDGECRWLDDQLAVIWQRLESGGLLDDTLVVLYTDHGEAFWEHGVQSHAHFLQAEENDAILWFWSRTMEARAWSGPTTAIDLVPTVLDALGLPVPDDGTLPGSVVGLAAPDRARFSSTACREGGLAAVTVEGDKLQFRFDGTLQLYDRDLDRQELVDRYDPEDPRVSELWELLRPRVELLSAAAPDLPVTWPAGN